MLITLDNNDDGREFGIRHLVLGNTTALLLILPMIFVVGKATHYSAYSSEGDYDGLAQLKDMRDSLEEDDGYSIANTMSTPMLVNDWKYPHRTMLPSSLLRNRLMRPRRSQFMISLQSLVARSL